MDKVREWFESWRLVSWRSAIVVAFILYALFGFLGVPWIAHKLITGFGEDRLDREITIDKIECNPFALSLAIEGFSLPDRPGSTLLSFDRFYANLQASSLFRWAWTLKELEIERPYIALRRFEDKVVNIVELKEALDRTAEPSDDEGGLPRAILEEILISDGTLEFENRADDVPLSEQWTQLSVQMDHVSTIPDEEGDKEITISLPGGGTLRVTGNVVLDPFVLDGRLSIDRLRVANLWDPVADRFTIDIAGGTAAAQINYEVSLQSDGLHLEVRDAEVTVQDFLVAERVSEAEIAQATSLIASGVNLRWPEQQIEGESLVIDGAAAFAWLEPDGTPSWEAWVPEKTRGEVVDAYKYVEERVDIDAKLARFEVRNAAATFEDRTFPEPLQLGIQDASLTLTDVASAPGTKWGLSTGAAIGDESRFSAEGTFSAAPLELDTKVELEGLELSPFQPYIAKAAPLDLQAGVLSTSGQARLAPSKEAPDITFTGELSVRELNLYETVTDGPLLGWGDLNVTGIEAGLAPTSLAVEKVDVITAGLEIAVDEEGRVNLLEFFKALGDTDDTSPETGTTGAEKQPPPARIALVELDDCYGLYKDATTVEPFERKLEAINGSISNITTTSEKPAEVEIDATVDSGGAAQVRGEIDLLDYQRFTDIDLDVRETHLPPMSMMSIKMVGFPIETGNATLDSSYDITDQQLVSTNHVEIDNLHFGEKVEGEGKINLPVKLGVSLLKDKNGRITLDVPIEGDLGNPEFVVASAVTAAVTDLIGEIAKSPFRLLARIGGGSEEQNLELIDFEAGTAVLTQNAVLNLDTLARALDERPSLDLGIEGAFDSQADAHGLRAVAFADSLGEEDQTAVAIERLEEMYRSQVSTTDLEALRQQYTTGTDEPQLDEPAYRAALVEGLIEVQPVDEDQVRALGPARAEVIRDYLVEQSGIEPARVSILPDTVDAATGEDRVRCRLSVDAGG
ncbi:MAG: DUF748 domain-containing protein [Acidobacteria bacterium]|nr:MAG: DUF748 domain-containing protein [Acidobacteriota bacterium]